MKKERRDKIIAPLFFRGCAGLNFRADGSRLIPEENAKTTEI
jgi:hypothetical protein